MIRGFARLPSTVDARLTIVGDGPCRNDLEVLAAEQGVSEKVTFTGATLDTAAALRNVVFTQTAVGIIDVVVSIERAGFHAKV